MARRTSRSRRSTGFLRSPYWSFGLAAFAIAGLLAIALGMLAPWPRYFVWLAAASLTTFAFYGIDKTRARNSGGRVPELILHSLAIGGGAPGGWAGLFFFHHKTRHPEFYLILLLSTLLHFGLIYFWILN